MKEKCTSLVIIIINTKKEDKEYAFLHGICVCVSQWGGLGGGALNVIR